MISILTIKQNLAMHDYTVLKAFSPYFAGAYFMRNGMEGWKSLGGILLCFTGKSDSNALDDLIY